MPSPAKGGKPNEHPNFLLIFTGNHGYGDVSAYHPSDVRTPNIDRIGTEGMLFTSMRANCTVCSPSRAALLTGCYADRVGVPGVIRTRAEDSWGFYKPGVPTLADELRKAGYHTGIIGKWHLGLESPNLPNERGFEFFHGFLGDMMDSFTTHLRHGNNYMRRNREVIEPKVVRREGGPQYGGRSCEAIIRGDWKLMQNDPFSPMELYNLKADPPHS
jgi:arylsulfatase A-like enzyme